MIKVHKIVEEPHEDPYEDDGIWSVVALAEGDEEDMFQIVIRFCDLDSAYKFTTHFKKSIEPILLDENTGMVGLI